MLLEVILAISLFAFLGAILHGSLNSALERVRVIERQNRAMDLAVSVLSEVRMGLIDPVPQGPEAFAEDDPVAAGWQWELQAEELIAGTDLPVQTKLTVIVSHVESGLVVRLVELLQAQKNSEDEEYDEEGGEL